MALDRSARLMTKVARLYHERGLRQPEIAELLHLSQPRVSRLLKEAVERGIVRTVVVAPEGLHADLEDALAERFGLRDAVVVDVDGAQGEVLPALAAAAAVHLDAALTGGERIGVSSWSETLVATVDAMTPKRTGAAAEVVQVVGGLGSPEVQVQATHLVSRLAAVTGTTPHLVPAPGLVGSAALREAMTREAPVARVTASWDELTMLLVGIGSLEPSPLLARSGNAVDDAETEDLRRRGAVGDVCLRFFDAAGAPVVSPLDERVVGITAAQLLAVPLRVGVAGGARKTAALRAAVLGGWVNVLVVDAPTAAALLDHPEVS